MMSVVPASPPDPEDLGALQIAARDLCDAVRAEIKGEGAEMPEHRQPVDLVDEAFQRVHFWAGRCWPERFGEDLEVDDPDPSSPIAEMVGQLAAVLPGLLEAQANARARASAPRWILGTRTAGGLDLALVPIREVSLIDTHGVDGGWIVVVGSAGGCYLPPSAMGSLIAWLEGQGGLVFRAWEGCPAWGP